MGKAGFASISQVQFQILMPSTSQSKMKPPVPSMTHSAYDIDRYRPNALLCCLTRCLQIRSRLTESVHARQSRRKGLCVFSTECCQDRWHRQPDTKGDVVQRELRTQHVQLRLRCNLVADKPLYCRSQSAN